MCDASCVRFFMALFFLVLICQGCASAVSREFPVVSTRPQACQRFFQELDEAVDQAGVRDASSFHVSGFPYLRTSRFLTALRGRVESDVQKREWVSLMRKLDLESREKEVRNLPEKQVVGLSFCLDENPSRGTLMERVAFCSDALLEHDLEQAGYFEALQSVVETPDEYSTMMRFAGLYPITALPVEALTYKARKKFEKWHKTSVDEIAVLGKLSTYVPEEKGCFSATEITRFVAGSSTNSLGLPILSVQQEQSLASALAPVFVQDVAGEHDLIGKIGWEGDQLILDACHPTVYYYFSHAFLKGKPVLQINYVIWYSARKGPWAPLIERGSLDGLTVRITLDAEGRPSMMDLMNTCGCYHFFAPSRNMVKGVVGKPFALDPFVPTWLPEDFPQKRLGLRVNSGWHQVQKVTAVDRNTDAKTYQLLPYEVLETLPQGSFQSESLFDEDGIAKGSERMEFLLLFSMGVSEVGSMRQRGHHPVKLVGRAHFDDPDIFDRNFIFQPDSLISK